MSPKKWVESVHGILCKLYCIIILAYAQKCHKHTVHFPKNKNKYLPVPFQLTFIYKINSITKLNST
jgi:hypothetical protein